MLTRREWLRRAAGLTAAAAMPFERRVILGLNGLLASRRRSVQIDVNVSLSSLWRLDRPVRVIGQN